MFKMGKNNGFTMRRFFLRFCSGNTWQYASVYLLGAALFFVLILILNNDVTSTEMDTFENPSLPSEINSPDKEEIVKEFPVVREFILDPKIKKYDNEDARVVGFVKKPSEEAIMPPVNASSTKVIYLATKYFNEWNAKHYYSLHTGDDSFQRYSCPNPNCRVTKDAQDIEKADAVLFHIRDLEVYSPPQIRSPHQVWILYGMEPPWLEIRDLRRFDGVFNWTMSYRRQSDLLVKYGFVGLRPEWNISTSPLTYTTPRKVFVRQEIPRTHDANSHKYFVLPDDHAIVQQDINVTAQNESSYARYKKILTYLMDTIRNFNKAQEEVIVKKDRAVWLVSNCRTDSRREEYVARLRKVFPVDVFGGCGEESCRPAETVKCYQKLARGYKFYLAFENAICRDYVTEKLFNSLEFEMVPVVLGGSDYSQLVPEHSVINAMDFDSPEDLGNFLLKVSEDDWLYKSYFWWKDTYRAYLQPWMCDLCSKLHETSPAPAKSKEDLEEWWNEGGTCKRWSEDGFQRAEENVFPAYKVKLFQP